MALSQLAGLLKQPTGRMYELRFHNLGEYFKTHLLPLGVQADYVDYMMGHAVDTYHDIQSLGVEKLRNTHGLGSLGKTQNQGQQDRCFEGNNSSMTNEL